VLKVYLEYKIDIKKDVIVLGTPFNSTNLLHNIIFDQAGKPIPQIFDEEANSGDGGWVAFTKINRELLAPETLTWNGVLVEQTTSDIDVCENKVLININNGSNKVLTVTLELKVGTDYIPYRGADGTEFSFDIDDDTHLVVGPVQCFPKYDGGRIRVKADTAPTDLSETIIQVQEV